VPGTLAILPPTVNYLLPKYLTLEFTNGTNNKINARLALTALYFTVILPATTKHFDRADHGVKITLDINLFGCGEFTYIDLTCYIKRKHLLTL